jgi:hypothetical protein
MSPDLQMSILCDDVRQERNGKFILIGVFDVIALPAYPAVFQRVCVVNRWCCGQGEFTQQTRIQKADGSGTLAVGREVKVNLADPEASATSVEFFLNLQFEREGTYWIEVLMDGDLKLRYPLKARRAQAPRQPSEA